MKWYADSILSEIVMPDYAKIKPTDSGTDPRLDDSRFVYECVPLPEEKVGLVMGKGGSTIKKWVHISMSLHLLGNGQIRKNLKVLSLSLMVLLCTGKQPMLTRLLPGSRTN